MGRKLSEERHDAFYRGTVWSDWRLSSFIFITYLRDRYFSCAFEDIELNTITPSHTTSKWSSFKVCCGSEKNAWEPAVQRGCPFQRACPLEGHLFSSEQDRKDSGSEQRSFYVLVSWRVHSLKTAGDPSGFLTFGGRCRTLNCCVRGSFCLYIR